MENHIQVSKMTNYMTRDFKIRKFSYLNILKFTFYYLIATFVKAIHADRQTDGQTDTYIYIYIYIYI